MMSFFKKSLLTTTAFSLLLTQVTQVYALDVPGAVSQSSNKTMLTARVLPSTEYESYFNTKLDSIFLDDIYAIELFIKNNSSQSLVFSAQDVLVKKATPLFTQTALKESLKSSDLVAGIMTCLFFPIGFFMLYGQVVKEELLPLINSFGPGENSITIKPNDEFKTMLFIEADNKYDKTDKKIKPLDFAMTVQLKDASKLNVPAHKRHARTFNVRIPNNK